MATNCSNNCDNCASVTTCHEAFGMKGHVHFEPRIAVINKYDGECTCCCQYVWPGGGIAFINELGMWEIRCKTHAPEMHGQALHMLNSCSGNCPNEPNPCGEVVLKLVTKLDPKFAL